MKKVALALAFAIALVALTYGVAGLLASNGRGAIAESWRTLESDEAFAAKFPAVAAKNDVAARLEAAAVPLGIGMMPRQEMDQLEEGTIDFARFAAFKQGVDAWITATVESPDDTIAAPPEEVSRYLAEHRAAIDAVLEILDHGEPPLWPVSRDGQPALRPIPNLMGQMQLSRILGAASLEATRTGDDARAWRCQQAAWTVAKGTLSRPEMISQLIGVAIARGVAGVSRKLDGPAPAWFHELGNFDFHRSMLDSCRSESNASSEAASADVFIEEMRAAARSENAHVGEILREAAMRPFVRWGITEMERVTVEELLRIEKADPCDIDSRAISAAIESRVPRLARALGGDFLPSTHAAFARVASVKIAIEGTTKVVELKARRAASPDGAWPVSADDLATSSCSRARWRYERHDDGSVRLVFDGKVDVPAGAKGYRIPLEYRAR